MKKKIFEAVNFIRTKTSAKPEMAVVLGTGLKNTADMLEKTIEIKYSDIPHFKQSTAPGHSGKLIFGINNGRSLVFMQGRLHYYEGYSMEELTFPIRVLAELGIKVLFLSNAAGSLNPAMIPGDIVVINDHLNLMGTNPLIGKNVDFQGERFPSMHEPYSKALKAQVKEIAVANNFDFKEGVYAAVSGPSLETKAECKMIRNLGADLVRMSTVPEVITAIHCGLNVIAVSVVTNLGNIFHSKPHTQEEIRANADKSSSNLKLIIEKINPY